MRKIYKYIFNFILIFSNIKTNNFHLTFQLFNYLIIDNKL